MNRADTIRVARESGFMPEITYELAEELERFAKQVAEYAAKAEREACAMVCAKWANSLNDSVSITALDICDAIRARSKHD